MASPPSDLPQIHAAGVAARIAPNAGWMVGDLAHQHPVAAFRVRHPRIQLHDRVEPCLSLDLPTSRRFVDASRGLDSPARGALRRRGGRPATSSACVSEHITAVLSGDRLVPFSGVSPEGHSGPSRASTSARA